LSWDGDTNSGKAALEGSGNLESLYRLNQREILEYMQSILVELRVISMLLQIGFTGKQSGIDQDQLRTELNTQ